MAQGNGYREVHARFAGQLGEALGDEREAQLDARLLLEAVCGTTVRTLLDEPDREVSAQELAQFSQLIGRRMEREPVAYILGEWEFMGLGFLVTPDVLIPEQDTEILVEEAMQLTPDGSRILDLCTGSGCILLSLLHYSNGSVGLGTDLSAEALAIAQRNAEKLSLSDRASFALGDLFGAVPCGEQFDLIISNPPYIATDVIPTLAREVSVYEPHMALDGGPDGLHFYRKIIQEAASHLVIGGYLMLEIGFDQADAVSRLLRDSGYYDIRVARDYGGNSRVVSGVRSIHQT